MRILNLALACLLIAFALTTVHSCKKWEAQQAADNQ